LPLPLPLPLLPAAAACSARSDQYNDQKREMLERIVQSFRLR
jgi:hypothetical protein